MIVNETAPSAQWEVLVIASGRVKRKVFGDDYAEAQRLFLRLFEQGHRATLRCKNSAFPPPAKLRPFRRPVTNRRGRVIDYELVVPMGSVNLKGKLWCPYCIRLRTFRKRNGFKLNGQFVNEPGLYCACGVSHRNFHVRKWNPLAARLYETPPRATRSDKRKD